MERICEGQVDMAHGLLAIHGSMDEEGLVSTTAAIPPPQTAVEQMEYLSRSWSVSDEEISKALLLNGSGKRSFFTINRPLAQQEVETSHALVAPTTASSHQIRQQQHVINQCNTFYCFFLFCLLLVICNCLEGFPSHHLRALPTISDSQLNATRTSTSQHSSPSTKWFFQHREAAGQAKRSRRRVDKAQAHAMVSVAQVSAAVAAITAATWCDNQNSKITAAMASATKLLASHCAEAAQLAGAGHERVSSAVRSAVGVASPGDLITLTAAAATALRGAETLKKRAQPQRETRSNASVLPYEKALSWTPDIWCKEGKLLKRTRNGDLCKRRVSIYINKRSQVILKLKSKHIGGALSKNNKSVVYGVYSEPPEWTEPGNGSPETCCFGLSTAQGLIEFKYESSTSKHNWVHGVQNLLRQVDVADQVGHQL